jgi:antitoxin MazE
MNMRTSVIRIGNSFGIRIPMPVIKECHLEGEIEMSVKNRGIHIHAVRKARGNWDESFRKMAKAGDDVLLDKTASPVSKWDKEEWQWK